MGAAGFAGIGLYDPGFAVESKEMCCSDRPAKTPETHHKALRQKA
jgi:hypothetical protein